MDEEINMIDAMTTTDVARYFTENGYPLKAWQVRRVFESGLIAEPETRLGSYRMIRPSDIPRLEDALRRAGYLPTEPALASSQT
jgi:hypothetical protein